MKKYDIQFFRRDLQELLAVNMSLANAERGTGRTNQQISTIIDKPTSSWVDMGIEYRIKQILTGLELTKEYEGMILKDLSGGEKRGYPLQLLLLEQIY